MKYATPVKNYKTLCGFKNIAQKVSSMFDVDMTEKYTGFINSYQEEVEFLNFSSNRLSDIATDYLYTREPLQYIADIDESCFIFDLEKEVETASILQTYSDECKKLEVKS